jgi:hypothetical protein
MAVTYPTTIKDARLQVVLDAISAGAGAGVLQIGTAAMASVLAEFTLTDPAGTISAGVLTLDFDPDISDSSANNSGTAAAARIRDSNGNDVVTGLTVGTSGTDIVLDSVGITAGQTVTITSGTITHA